MDLDRRKFLQGGVLAGGALAIAGLAGCSTPSGSTAANSSSSEWDKETDILVIGGGIGGTIAGYVASQGGAKTIVAEAGDELGGSFLITTGALHTGMLTTPDDIEKYAKTGDMDLNRDFMEKWVEFRDSWLLDTGAPNATQTTTATGISLVSVGKDYETRKEFIDFFGDEITGAGGEIILNTQGTELVADESNAVIGAVLCGNDGTLTRVGAKSVILACGGFGANPSMAQEHLGQYADQGVPRTVPFNTAAGHHMAMALGAQLTKGMGMFYGHVVPWPNPIPSDADGYNEMDKDTASLLLRTVQSFSANSMIVNINGKRFVDESGKQISSGDSYAATMLLQQEMGRGYSIIDSSNETFVGSAKKLIDLGVTVDVADSLDALADMLTARGVYKANLMKTFDEYNNADPATFEIPQSGRISGSAAPLTQPPFYAVQVTGGYSALFGGVKINTDAQVIGLGNQPIQNLYATACCAGGFAYGEYVGSLSLSAVYGKTAAEQALAAL